MKRLALVVIAVLAVAWSGCGEDPELQKLKKQNAGLQTELVRRAAYVDDVTRTINEIEDRLGSITRREKLLLRVSSQISDIDTTSPQARRIRADFLAVEEHLADVRNRMDRLQRKMDASAVRISGLMKMVSRLQETIAQKDTVIARLRFQNRALLETVVGLEGTIAEQTHIISRTTDAADRLADTVRTQRGEIRKAFYLIGTADDMETKGLLARTGGFMGRGATLEPATGYDGPARIPLYTRIDDRENSRSISVPLATGQRIVGLLPPREEGSYRVLYRPGYPATLTIWDPAAFWTARCVLILIGT
jgi:hypothetical protein